ncbi:MAG: hypothetical protein JWQ23_2061 [Herminiimonas sp.]|nr:hypothetical protein [Herminiimonas sp.]
MKRMVARLFTGIGIAIAVGAASLPAMAQTYPERPIKLIVGFPPGGGGDVLGRLLAVELNEAWKQPVIVDNRPGAGANIASEAVARSAADGYTLLIGGDFSHAINPALYKKLAFDTKKDFAPVTRLANYPMIIAVHPSVPANSLREFITLAKASPGKFEFASSGNGTPPHLAGVLFNQEAGLDILHIPFKGGGPAVTSTVAGQTALLMGTGPSTIPQAKAGKLRILAVTTRDSSPVVPGAPGTAEAGLPSLNINGWWGMWAPAGTPQAVIDKLFEKVSEIMQRPGIQEKLGRSGLVASTSRSPAEFGEFVDGQARVLGKLVRDTGTTVD